MGNRVGALRLAKLAAALAAAAMLSACSAANFANFAPMPGNKAKPVAVASVTPAPKPAAARETGETSVALLSFAEPPRSGPADVNRLISKYAAHYNVPESLVHRVVKKESGYNPKARNGPFLGLMQIRHDTARSMGYRGDAAGLLDADTNLKYAVKYLRGAYVVGGYSQEAAMRNYQRGYYYDAKRQGLLKEAGLR
jgi:soluble lytic murein transglycosylase-like protein